MRETAPRPTALIDLALLAYAAAWTVGQLLPLDISLSASTLAEKYRLGRIVFNPFVSGARLPDVMTDALLAVPIGVLATTWGRREGVGRRIVPRVLGVVFLLAAFEAVQILVISRTAEAADVAAGALGVLAGVWMSARVSGAQVRSRACTRRQPAAVIALLGSAAVYAAYNWSPFDFHLAPELVRERLTLLLQPPALSYYANPETQAFGTAALKLVLGVPIGAFGSRAFPARGRYPRMMTAMFVGAGSLFFAGVEAGQLALASRFPDNTDILLATSGLCAGLVLTRPAGGRQPCS